MMLATTFVKAQSPAAKQTANYEAANWQTKLVHQKISTAAPPSAAQTKTELQIIKQNFYHG